MKGYESRSNERNDECDGEKKKKIYIYMSLEIVRDPGMGEEDSGRPKTDKE